MPINQARCSFGMCHRDTARCSFGMCHSDTARAGAGGLELCWCLVRDPLSLGHSNGRGVWCLSRQNIVKQTRQGSLSSSSSHCPEPWAPESCSTDRPRESSSCVPNTSLTDPSCQPGRGLGGLQEDCARAVALTATQTSVEGGTARTLAEPQISTEPPAGPSSTGRLWAEEM